MQSVPANGDMRPLGEYVGFSEGIADEIADSGATGVAILLVGVASFLAIAAGAAACWAGW